MIDDNSNPFAAATIKFHKLERDCFPVFKEQYYFVLCKASIVNPLDSVNLNLGLTMLFFNPKSRDWEDIRHGFLFENGDPIIPEDIIGWADPEQVLDEIEVGNGTTTADSLETTVSREGRKPEAILHDEINIG